MPAHDDLPEGDPPRAEGAAETDTPVSARDLVIDSIGGWRGAVDAGLPAAGFIIANLIAGLRPAVWAGISIAIVVFVLRLVRKQSFKQAIGGLIGVGICVFIASRTGEARGYFLFGIWRSALLAAALLGSVLVRYPAVGVVWEFLSPERESRTDAWRRDRRLMRAYNWTTLGWAASYVLKFIVEGLLYQSHQATWLGVVRLGMGYPLTIGLLLLTFVVLRRVRGEAFTLRLLRRRWTAPADGD